MNEICDNAKDDDGDALVDLNDEDCKCPRFEPVSLLPNPSFETIDCCPQTNGALNCAKGWVQASEPTTDLLHTCGWLGFEELPPPFPFPDGEACVGLRNGSSFTNWKEYAAACLLAPLRAGMAYRLRFYVGFTQARNSPRTKLTLFGTMDCGQLPFGLGIPDFGCPSNASTWIELGAVMIEGNSEWKMVDINFTPPESIRAIALGPDCTPGILRPEAYYFLDNLILDERDDFEFFITATGTPCTENYILQVPQFDALQYQWYKDGVALPEETKAQLHVKQGAGHYVVRVSSAVACNITLPFDVKAAAIYTQLNESICQSEQYQFGDQVLRTSGIYQDTFKTAYNCDSIVTLTLRVTEEVEDTVHVKILEGEFYEVGERRFNRAGRYEIALPSVAGCDSVVQLDLQFYKVFFPSAFSPNDDGQNDYFTILGGADLVLIKQLQVFDRWGNVVFDKKDFSATDGWNGQFNGKAAPNGVYVYTAQLLMKDGVERQFQGWIVLVR